MVHFEIARNSITGGSITVVCVRVSYLWRLNVVTWGTWRFSGGASQRNSYGTLLSLLTGNKDAVGLVADVGPAACPQDRGT